MRPLLALLLLAVAAPPGAGLAETDPPFHEDLALGRERLRHGDLPGAREVFEASLARDPGDRRRHMALAELFTLEDPPRLDRFEERARQAYRVDPSSPLPLVRLSRALREAGSLGRAEAVAHEGLAAFPEHPALLQALGNLHLARGEHGPALRALGKAARRAPSDPGVEHDLGLAMAEAEEFGGALLRLQRARERDPHDLAVRRALAAVYRGIDDTAHAAEEAEAVRQLELLEVRAAERKRSLRRLSRRIHELEQAAAGKRPPAGTFAELWELGQHRGDLAWTLPRLERLAAARDSLEARGVLGLVRAALGKGEEAWATLQAVLEEAPAEPHALRGLFRYAATAGPEALKVAAERAVKAVPDSSDAHMFVGLAQLRMNDPAGAEASLRRALELENPRPEAYQQLVAALQRQGKEPEVAEVLRRALERFPETPSILLSAGLKAAADGREEEARQHLSRAQDLGGRHPRIFSALGHLAAAREERLVATAYYNLSLQENPNQPRLRAYLASAG